MVYRSKMFRKEENCGGSVLLSIDRLNFERLNYGKHSVLNDFQGSAMCRYK